MAIQVNSIEEIRQNNYIVYLSQYDELPQLDYNSQSICIMAFSKNEAKSKAIKLFKNIKDKYINN